MSTSGADGYRPFPGIDGWETPSGIEVVDSLGEQLDELRRSASAAELERAVEIATRQAAIETGAIEGLYTVDRGFTRTVATQAANWEHVLHARGEKVERSITDALNGYELVLDAVTQHLPITQAWIRELHATLCASQETYTVHTDVGPQEHRLEHGQYKTMPNSPLNLSSGRVHHYASVHDTQPEMERLVDILRGDAFAEAHPVIQAAYAHYAYVCVHPFADGNGRVARALASVYLYRSPGVPLVVFSDQREQYIDALELADAGEVEALSRFVTQRTIDTAHLVAGTVRTSQEPSASESLESLRTAPPVSRALEIARLLSLFDGALRTAISETPLPDGVTLGVAVAGEDELELRATAAGHPLRVVSVRYGIPRGQPGAAGVELITSDGGGHLTVYDEWFMPHETTVGRLRLQTFADEAIRRILARLAATA